MVQPSKMEFPYAMWKAFTLPLQENEDRFINLDTLEAGAELDISQNLNQLVYQIFPDDITNREQVNWQEPASLKIISWLLKHNQNISHYYKESTSLEKHQKSDFYYKGNPNYAKISHNIIDGILSKNAIYKNEIDARNVLNKIRSRYTCKRFESGEKRDLFEYLYILSYEITDEQKQIGVMGNYAKISIIHKHSAYMLVAENVSHLGWKHPMTDFAKSNANQDSPSWNQKTFKALKNEGKVKFRTLAHALKEMKRIGAYKNARIYDTGKINVMVWNKLKKPPYDYITIRLSVDDSGNVYLYMTPQDGYTTNAKSYGSIESSLFTSSDLKSIFDINDEISLMIASFFMEEIQIREGRRSSKISELKETDLIYHFTDTEIMQKIIQEKTLWLSDLRLMNDRTETYQGYEAFSEYLKVYKNSSGVKDNRDEWSESVIDTVENSLQRSSNNALYFGTSFTDQRDNSQHWENYGRKGAGVALGFDRKALSRVAAQSGAHLRKTIYIRERQTELITTSMERVLKNTALRSIPPANVGKAILNILTNINPIFKHKNFNNEYEWRLFIQDNSDNKRWKEEERLRDRDNPSAGRVGYIEAKFVDPADEMENNNSGKLLINSGISKVLTEVVILKRNGFEQRRIEIIGFLRRREWAKGIDVTYADVPLA